MCALLAILSDLHGNLSATSAVMDDMEKVGIQDCVILGDLVDNCMRPNEVISLVRGLDMRTKIVIAGNHDRAVIDREYSRFSTERGKKSAELTTTLLNPDSEDYLKNLPRGKMEMSFGGKRFLAVHGTYEDNLWGKLSIESNLTPYSEYDYVLSGHTHFPHMFEIYYPADDPVRRNLKKTIFINPGSVGQPRNMNPLAQYVILDTGTESVEFRKVVYDISAEQDAFDGSVDLFYSDRLGLGI